MHTFELKQLLEQAETGGHRYHEFLSVPDLSMGLYRLQAGEADPQSPHDQDEVYYVLKGRASIQVNGAVSAVEPGSIVYVEARAAHKFIDIEDDLTVLVFFAPAETS
jgi:mannose-6-phosphate isomerase-like protein (cupin superfamily)